MLRLTLIALFSLCVWANAWADDDKIITAAVGRISTENWAVSGLESDFNLTAEGLSGEIRIAQLSLHESGQVFEEIKVACRSFVLTTRQIRCDESLFTLTIPGIGRQAISGAFTYDRKTGDALVDLTDMAIAGGRVSLNIEAYEAGISTRFSGQGLALDKLLEIAAVFGEAFSDYSAGGLADIAGRLELSDTAPAHLVLESELSGMSLSNISGTIAADGVGGSLDLDIRFEGDQTRLNVGFESNEGEAYIEPIYASFSAHALKLDARNVLTSDYRHFDVDRFTLQQDKLLDVSGSTSMSFPADDSGSVAISADLQIENAAVENLYTNLIKIAAAGTVLGNLETAGVVSGSVRIKDNALRSVRLQLDDLFFDDSQRRFAIYAVNGQVDWSVEKEHTPGVTQLTWDSGSVYSIAVGSGEASFLLGKDDVELLNPLRLTTMGGALLINRLVLNDFGSETASGQLDAELEPIQLGQLSGAFGWPAFSGRLSGRLPLLQLEDNTITVGGTLSAEAFDGTIEMTGLRIERPFGRVPQLHGELTLRNLDLQRVTEVFSFGLIQGRLSGDIAGLKMQNWNAVSMDMHFYTAEDDRSQRRISQRAVENLASVGGSGAAAVLSTGFLKFFDVFAYDRIGLRCVLRDGVCKMSGAGPAKTGPQGRGYYIVKGSGLPRIDVVGYRDTVSWARLVQQLTSISRSGSPSVNP